MSRISQVITALSTEQYAQFPEVRKRKNLGFEEQLSLAEKLLKGESISESFSGYTEHKPVAEIIEGYRERQYKAYLAGGMSEVEAAAVANYTPNKA